jgi:hypothetical protein
VAQQENGLPVLKCTVEGSESMDAALAVWLSISEMPPT